MQEGLPRSFWRIEVQAVQDLPCPTRKSVMIMRLSGPFNTLQKQPGPLNGCDDPWTGLGLLLTYKPFNMNPRGTDEPLHNSLTKEATVNMSETEDLGYKMTGRTVCRSQYCARAAALLLRKMPEMVSRTICCRPADIMHSTSDSMWVSY
jgi:hypothetical protein